jgi:MiaB-like tRNA modifying enzyme
MFLFLFEPFNVLRWCIMKVFIKSFGCSTNLADGEVLAGCLSEAGYVLTDSVIDADIVIYNTCAVKGPTENRIIGILKRAPKEKKLIIVGCLPLINFERLKKEIIFHGVSGPAVGEQIVDIVRRVLNDEKVIVLNNAFKTKPSLRLPKIRSNPIISIIPVNYGCLGSCAYCCVVFARGHLRSYSVEEIVERVKTDLAEGVKEFWITSQDTASYGKDINATLAELLQVACKIEGNFKIRVGMMTPNIAMNTLDDLIQVFKSEKVFKFVHLPVQSGDDQVLKKMCRLYSVKDFIKIIEAFRTNFPRITVATDVICGFPGESKEAFKKTLELMREVKPDIVNVSKFFARPKTLAADMKEDFIPFSEIKCRSRVVANLAKEIALEKNQKWIGWEGEVLVDEVGKVSHSWIGRNFAYKPIVVRSADNLFGKIVKVKVVKAFSTHLEGELV